MSAWTTTGMFVLDYVAWLMNNVCSPPDVRYTRTLSCSVPIYACALAMRYLGCWLLACMAAFLTTVLCACSNKFEKCRKEQKAFEAAFPVS
jgi:hypothetical protein